MDYASAAFHRAKEEMRRADVERFGQEVYNEFLRRLEVWERDRVNTENARASLAWEGSPTDVGPAPTLEGMARELGRAS